MRTKKFNIKSLTITSMMIALAIILEQIKLFQMPQGGSVTLLGMLPIALLGYLLGIKYGVIGGFCVGILNIIFGAYIIHPVQLFIDYLLSYSVLGLSGIFRNKNNGLVKGYLFGVMLRYLCFVLSGTVFFGDYAPVKFNALTWSIWYNLTFTAVEVLITLIIINIPALKNLFINLKSRVEA